MLGGRSIEELGTPFPQILARDQKADWETTSVTRTGHPSSSLHHKLK